MRAEMTTNTGWGRQRAERTDLDGQRHLTPPLPPPDPALEALPVALDGGAMRELLDKRLPDCASGAFQVESCRPRYVKYRPGVKCTVGYKLALYDATAGSTIKTFAHARMYPGLHAEKLWSQPVLGRLVEQAATGHAHQPSRRAAYIPNLRALVQLYPVDLDLPGLVEATSSSAVRGKLQQALNVSLQECLVEMVRYKPGRKAVLRYRLSGAGVDTVYGKLQPDDRGGILSGVSQALKSVGVNTPAPLAYLSDMRMLVAAEATGTRLKDLKGTMEYVEWMPPVAEALARLHTAPLDGQPAHLSRDETVVIWNVALMIGTLLPALAMDTARLAKSLISYLGAISVPAATVHGDFHDDQVIVSDSGVTLLDFEEVQLGNPLLDVGNFLAHLSARHAKRPDAADGPRTGFLDAYASLRPDARKNALLFEAAWLLRLSIGPFRKLAPDWPEAVERRVDLARQRLEEYERSRMSRIF